MSSGWIRAPGLLFLDTIPLLLFLVGDFDPACLKSFRRLSTYNYTEDDFEILKSFLLRAGRVAVTAGVLSEVSNFLTSDGHFSRIAEGNMNFLMRLDEIFVEKNKILGSNDFLKLAFTDTSLQIAARDHHGSILTRDRKLWGVCRGQGIRAHHLDDLLAMRDLILKGR